MKALPILAALAVLAAIARLARELRDVQPATVSQSAADASDVVGMPTVIHLSFDKPRPAIDWEAFFDTAGRRN